MSPQSPFSKSTRGKMACICFRCLGMASEHRKIVTENSEEICINSLIALRKHEKRSRINGLPCVFASRPLTGLTL